MTEDHPAICALQSLAGEALLNHGENRRELLVKAADEARKEMERKSLCVRDLILVQPPAQLLAYMWMRFHMEVLSDIKREGDEYRPNKGVVKKFQLAFEYMHAVWSSHPQLAEESDPLDEKKVAELFNVLESLEAITMLHCLTSSAAQGAHSRAWADTEFHAKSSWVLIRGHRYQVLEEEFFRFVLKPHSDALQTAYGMDGDAVAAGIQSIANSIRGGFGEAIQKMHDAMDQTYTLMEETGEELGAAITKLRDRGNETITAVSGAIKDFLFGGICSLSRHTSFTPGLLQDLSFIPGENTEFFADGDFRGTPLRTLPARVKPGINLNEEYYCTDGQFVRDAAYRAIQRGLLNRIPQYREEWKRRQQQLVEKSYPEIFAKQLAHATKYSQIYFPDPTTGQWVESDTIMALEDVLFVIEAKAGVMAMHSPATNFDRHERAIRELIVKAYEQCKRFLEYLASSNEVRLYNHIEGEFVEVGRLRYQNFRVILPIGLTVESFTPFSAMSKQLPEIQPLQRRYAFISMSVDDLFVLNRFLPTTGELLHYLEVRQHVASIPNAVLFDEIEHLGAYISDNRFDMTIKEQLKDADMVTWDSFGDVVDKHFEGDSWKTAPAPHQEFPKELSAILEALDLHRPSGWLEMDAHVRNLSGVARSNLAQVLINVKASLSQHALRRFILGEENPLQVWVYRDSVRPSEEELRRQGQIGCLAVSAPRILVLQLSYRISREIVRVACTSFVSPSVLQINYPDLKRQAERQRARLSRLAPE